MPIDKIKLDKVKTRITKDIQEVVADLKDIVEASKETFNDLKTDVPPSELADLILVAATPYVHIPWYVPNFVIKAVLTKTITDIEQKL
jgi:hypothetical protein